VDHQRRCDVPVLKPLCAPRPGLCPASKTRLAIAPQFAKPHVNSNNNDGNYAEAICEAMSRPSMPFMQVKDVEQQDIQTVHRIREELMSQRTAKANQIHGLVTEYGLVAPKNLSQLRAALPGRLEDADNGLTERSRQLVPGLWCDLMEPDR